MRRMIIGLAGTLALNLGLSSIQAAVLVEDSFEGSAGATADAAKFEWSGNGSLNGNGRLDLQTWSMNHSWLQSKAGAALELGQTLVLHLRAYAYAEDWSPGVYGDGQPRGLRVGTDANNAAEFYSISRSGVGLRVRKDGVESAAEYTVASGVDSMHDYEVSVTTTSVCFKVDGEVAGTFTANIPAGVLNAYVSTYDGGGGAGNVPVSLDSLSLTLTDDVGAPLDFAYTTNSGAIAITGYTGPGGAVAIPSAIHGLPVTSIEINAFAARVSLNNVSIPDTVASIGPSAFESCVSLTNVTIGAGVTNIGYHSFFNCVNLMAFGVAGLNPALSSLDGVVFSRDQSRILLCPAMKSGNYTVPGSVTAIGEGAFDHCTELTGVVIPDSVTNIESGAFYACCRVAGLVIGNSVMTIGNLAFYNCVSLTNVMIPDCVVSLHGAFSDCAGLESVTLGRNLADIGNAFVRCTNLRRVVIPNGVSSIGDMAFAGCNNLANIVIPASVSTIGDSALSGCASLTNLIIPDSVTHLGSYAFHYCTGLRSVEVGQGVTRIRDNAFNHCSGLTSIVVPGNIVSIGANAVANCVSLTQITIPNSVTTIASGAFSGCTSLVSITMPSSVSGLEDWSFYGCTNLTGVYFAGNAPTTGPSLFAGADHATVYYLPGTTGWDTTFGNRPAELWNPQVLLDDGTFGLRSNQFGFTIAGGTNLAIVVEASSNLAAANWMPVGTNVLSGGSCYFSDPEWTNYPRRFYRLRSP